VCSSPDFVLITGVLSIPLGQTLPSVCRCRQLPLLWLKDGLRRKGSDVKGTSRYPGFPNQMRLSSDVGGREIRMKVGTKMVICSPAIYIEM